MEVQNQSLKPQIKTLRPFQGWMWSPKCNLGWAHSKKRVILNLGLRKINFALQSSICKINFALQSSICFCAQKLLPESLFTFNNWRVVCFFIFMIDLPLYFMQSGNAIPAAVRHYHRFQYRLRHPWFAKVLNLKEHFTNSLSYLFTSPKVLLKLFQPSWYLEQLQLLKKRWTQTDFTYFLLYDRNHQWLIKLNPLKLKNRLIRNKSLCKGV